MGFEIVFRKSLQFTMTTVINVFERRFNGLFWIAFDFFISHSICLPRPPSNELLSIHHDYLIKKVFFCFSLGHKSTFSLASSPHTLVFFFNYCLLTNRTKQKFVIKFCAVANQEKNGDKNGDWQKQEKKQEKKKREQIYLV